MVFNPIEVNASESSNLRPGWDGVSIPIFNGSGFSNPINLSKSKIDKALALYDPSSGKGVELEYGSGNESMKLYVSKGKDGSTLVSFDPTLTAYYNDSYLPNHPAKPAEDKNYASPAPETMGKWISKPETKSDGTIQGTFQYGKNTYLKTENKDGYTTYTNIKTGEVAASGIGGWAAEPPDPGIKSDQSNQVTTNNGSISEQKPEPAKYGPNVEAKWPTSSKYLFDVNYGSSNNKN
jgi:hypothetical protein